MVHYSAAVTAALSSGAFATTLTGVGILVGAPVAGVAALTGLASTGLSVINKKLEKKIDKHTKIEALALAKHDSINSFVSQVLDDNRISDAEFEQITHEMQKYRQLKEVLRTNSVEKQTDTQQPDLEMIKSQIREELLKKLASSRKTKISLSVIRKR